MMIWLVLLSAFHPTIYGWVDKRHSGEFTYVQRGGKKYASDRIPSIQNVYPSSSLSKVVYATEAPWLWDAKNTSEKKKQLA